MGNGDECWALRVGDASRKIGGWAVYPQMSRSSFKDACQGNWISLRTYCVSMLFVFALGLCISSALRHMPSPALVVDWHPCEPCLHLPTFRSVRDAELQHAG